MQVYFVSSGIGGVDNLTIKAYRLISLADIIIYAGSLIPEEIVEIGKTDAKKYDSSVLNLNQIEEIFVLAKEENKNVVRLQSGDTFLYSAINEQIEILKQHKIEYEVIPGVTSASAFAAIMKLELTAPNVCQTIVLTRINGRTKTMPPLENYLEYVKTGACVVIHLAITKVREIVKEVSPIIGIDSIIAIGYRIGYNDQEVSLVPLSNAAKFVRSKKMTRQAILVINPLFNLASNQEQSKLYSKDYVHLFRN